MHSPEQNAALASGRYSYHRDDLAQPIVEPWSLLPTAAGLLLSGQRLVDGERLLDIRALYQQGLCRQLELHWKPDSGKAHRSLRYRYAGGTLYWEETGGEPTQFEAPGALLYPLLRAATGPLLLQLSRPQGVLLPDLREPSAACFLQPLLSERRVEAGRADTGGHRHLRYFGGEYGDAGCDCWLDSAGFVSRYTWESAQGRWDVRLEDLRLAAGFGGIRSP